MFYFEVRESYEKAVPKAFVNFNRTPTYRSPF